MLLSRATCLIKSVDAGWKELTWEFVYRCSNEIPFLSSGCTLFLFCQSWLGSFCFLLSLFFRPSITLVVHQFNHIIRKKCAKYSCNWPQIHTDTDYTYVSSTPWLLLLIFSESCLANLASGCFKLLLAVISLLVSDGWCLGSERMAASFTVTPGCHGNPLCFAPIHKMTVVLGVLAPPSISSLAQRKGRPYLFNCVCVSWPCACTCV